METSAPHNQEENVMQSNATVEEPCLPVAKAATNALYTAEEQVLRLKETNEQLDAAAKLLVRRDLELSRANEMLHELDKKKTEFVSLVTHQLRTPLSGVKWSISMLLDGELGPLTPDQRLYLMKTYESNERMITLINDMLRADRIETGSTQVSLVPTQITSLIENVLMEMRVAAEKKNITLGFNAPIGIPLLSIDPSTMRVVLQNILDNALKYTPSGGRVDISVVASENAVECIIADTGIGIPKDLQGRVFQRFFRAPNAVHAETDGSGLGLYIVENIVRKHNGTIRFTSEEGKGTTIIITLPIMHAAPKA